MMLGQKNALLEQEVARILEEEQSICSDVEIIYGEVGQQSTSEH